MYSCTEKKTCQSIQIIEPIIELEKSINLHFSLMEGSFALEILRIAYNPISSCLFYLIYRFLFFYPCAILKIHLATPRNEMSSDNSLPISFSPPLSLSLSIFLFISFSRRFRVFFLFSFVTSIISPLTPESQRLECFRSCSSSILFARRWSP